MNSQQHQSGAERKLNRREVLSKQHQALTIAKSTSPSSTGNKGAGMWAAWHIGDMVKDSGVTWAYTWGPDPAAAFTIMSQSVLDSVELVPMVFVPSKADDATLEQIKSSGTEVVLGYNEPDGVVSLADAVSAWTKITQQLSGLRIGSPAPANVSVHNADDWFVKFMQQTKANGAKVDFICLHHYAKETDVASALVNFKKKIDEVPTDTDFLFGLPSMRWLIIAVWILLQFKLPDPAIHLKYVKKSAAMLKGLAYVERFAWFAMPQNDVQPDKHLYTQNQSDWQSTPFGEAYKAV